MTNDPPHESPGYKALLALQNLGREDIPNYLEQKGATKDCAACGSTQWQVMNPIIDGFMKLDLHRTTAESELETRAVPVFCLLCVNCGHVRLHAATPLGEWKLQQEARSKKGGK